MKKVKLILTLYISVIALAVASVSMSVAWFVTSRNLFVSGIDISFDADRELEISESKDDGYTDHIMPSIEDESRIFVPLTTAHSSIWTSQKLDRPIFYDESNASEIEDFVSYRAVEEGAGYFTKKIYLRADDDLLITIDPEKTFIKANEEYNAKYAKYLHSYYKNIQDEHYARYKVFTVDELYERLNRIVEAMRFSILIKDGDEYSYTIIDPFYKEDTYIGGLLDNAMDGYYDSFLKKGSNEYYERVYGDFSGELVYDEPLAEDSSYLEENVVPTAFNARHQKGVKPVNFEKSKNEKGFEIKKEGAINLKDFNNKEKPFSFPIYMDTPKEIVISLYIEGWDLDSVNYTMGAAFTSDLTFKIEREL